MNIFFLDTCPQRAARCQVKKSAIKMILESAQLLSAAVRLHGYDGDDVYKISHKNHPSSIWCRANQANFLWLAEHGLELCDMYTRESGKIHKSQAIIERCIDLIDLLPNDSDEPTIYKAMAAIKSSDVGLAAFNRLPERPSFDQIVDAYRPFYFSKQYVQEHFQKLAID